MVGRVTRFKILIVRRHTTNMRDLRALSHGFILPGIHAVVVDAPSLSYFGGAPQLPPSTQWPVWKGQRLSFLARVSLAELNRAHRVEWLPQSGALLFFYDTDNQPWGFDPKDRGCCAVLHVPDLATPISVRDTTGGQSIPHRSITFRRIHTHPSSQRESVRALELSEAELEEYLNLVDAAFTHLPKHQIAGLPSPVQGDQMELECQLASNGQYCGDSSGYIGPRADALKPGAKDWRLLFQLDSDDDLGVMWGDCGMLYFWVQEDEAKGGRFANTWLILQCA